MRITIAQINTTVGDFDSNSQKVIKAISFATKNSSDVIVFPELTLTGYPPKDLLLQNEFIERQDSCLDEIIKTTEGIYVIIGVVEKNKSDGKPFFNSALVINNKKIIHKHRKFLLPFYDVFDEGRYFEPGKKSKPVMIKDYQVYLTICEDIWNDKNFWEKRRYNYNPLEKMIKNRKKGKGFVVNISASPFYVGKIDLREDILNSITTKYKMPMIYVNLVGGNDELVFDGNSLVLNKDGEIVKRLKCFEEDIETFDLEDLRGGVEARNYEYEDTEIADIYKALVLGTRDYVTKCGFKKAVVGLSGGIDSSVVSVIGTEALGRENILAVSMPSRFTSEESVTDAKIVAKNLGIQLITISIEKVFKAYLEILSEIFKNREWDVTEENLQARIRGAILMALSNKFNYLVLTTGNKSELAMGYCTLYGDMCGGLCVVGDVFKTDIYRLGRHINDIMNKEIIPERVFKKAPTAELRPNQTDQDTLPSYFLLDEILRSYIEEEFSSEDIMNFGFDKNLVRNILRTVDNNEFKRRQSAPCIKISPRAFGFGRRMPIAQRFHR